VGTRARLGLRYPDAGWRTIVEYSAPGEGVEPYAPFALLRNGEDAYQSRRLQFHAADLARLEPGKVLVGDASGRGLELQLVPENEFHAVACS
jgi:hypothetical protein